MDEWDDEEMLEFVAEYLNPEAGLYETIGDELTAISTAFKNRLLDLFTSLTALEASLEDNLESLDVTRTDVCATWDDQTAAQHAADRTAIAGVWDNIEADSQRLITTLRDWRDTLPFTVPPYLQQSLAARLAQYEQDRADRVAERNAEPPLGQTSGDKVRADGPIARNSVLFERLQKQILPPRSLARSEGRWYDHFATSEMDDLGLGNPAVDGGNWRGLQIGAGGQGSAWEWQFVDREGNIISRVARKDTQASPTTAEWNHPRGWYGDTSVSAQGGDCLPLEAHTQALMGEVPAADRGNTIQLLTDPLVFWERRFYRLYMEYAPNGDSDGLITRHLTHREPIPETFLWLVFRALLRNAVIMEQGRIDNPRHPWSVIVHRDFKAENLFLGISDPKFYAQYPEPKLGDFGLAFPTNANDTTNPDMWAEGGTDGHLAPEQMYWNHSVSKKPMNTVKMLSPTNIYGLATIMYQLMERTWLNSATQPLIPPDSSSLPDSNTPTLPFSALTKALYNDQEEPHGLCRLVQRCLRADPDTRPSATSLLTRVETRLNSPAYRRERDGGYVDPLGDTLLLPDVLVNLQWASRLEAGVDGIHAPRTVRVAEDDGREDEEMTDAE